MRVPPDDVSGSQLLVFKPTAAIGWKLSWIEFAVQTNAARVSVTGSKVELAELANTDALLALALITVIAIVSKLAGGFLGALPLGKRGALIVGVGMIPRGEVGVVVASLGLAAGVFSPRTYALIVAMSLLTAMITPPVLAALLRADGIKK